MFESSLFAGVLLIVYIVSLILGVVLFFKVWGMTNNVSRILELLENNYRKEEPRPVAVPCDKFEIGDKVVIIKTGKVTFVTEINGDMYECASNNGTFYDGIHKAEELHKF